MERLGVWLGFSGQASKRLKQLEQVVRHLVEPAVTGSREAGSAIILVSDDVQIEVTVRRLATAAKPDRRTFIL